MPEMPFNGKKKAKDKPNDKFRFKKSDKSLDVTNKGSIREAIPELDQLERLILRGKKFIKASTLTTVKDFDGREYPIYLLQLGSASLKAPALSFIGGVHGVERIGSQVIIAYLETLVERLRWDKALQEKLECVSLFAIPILNPVGMKNNTRSNGNGVDLMRNAPIDSEEKVTFLPGGHRISRKLPWFRGDLNVGMEKELQALYRFVKTQQSTRPFVLTLDCHSGFGLNDRIWFPYARSRKPIKTLGLYYRLYRLFCKAYRNHSFYVFEPQCRHYITHGDIWDLLCDEALEKDKEPQMAKQQDSERFFLPLTLEMGSWLWVKKNPWQLFRFHSIFHPIVPHRHQRILRRHYPLFDFLLSATVNYKEWPRRSEKKSSVTIKQALSVGLTVEKGKWIFLNRSENRPSLLY